MGDGVHDGFLQGALRIFELIRALGIGFVVSDIGLPIQKLHRILRLTKDAADKFLSFSMRFATILAWVDGKNRVRPRKMLCDHVFFTEQQQREILRSQNPHLFFAKRRNTGGDLFSLGEIFFCGFACVAKVRFAQIAAHERQIDVVH